MLEFRLFIFLKEIFPKNLLSLKYLTVMEIYIYHMNTCNS